MIRVVCLTLFIALFPLWQAPVWSSAQAATQNQPPLSQEQITLVRQALSYLNNINTLRGEFVQVTSNGNHATGEVLVDRPGKARFEYNPPSPVLLIANGVNLLYYDKELEQATFIPVHETPLWFLLRENIRIDHDLEIIDVKSGHGVFDIVLEEKNNPSKGRVSIHFSKNPIALLNWRLTDAQGVTTKVSLVNPTFGGRIDRDKFNTRKLPGIGFGDQYRQ